MVTPDPLPVPPPGEAMLSTAWAQACVDFYRGQRSAAKPGISPLRADLSGLPPTLIQAGTDELLHDQALALETALQAAGVHSPLRDHATPLACVPAARRRAQKRGRSHRAPGQLCARPPAARESMA